VEQAYRSWVDETWKAVFKHQQAENAALWEDARYATLARHCGLVYPRGGAKIVEEEERSRIEVALMLGASDVMGCLSHVEVFCDTRWSLLAVGYMRGSEACLVFRGTLVTNLSNWRLNFDMRRRESGLHQGFARAWEALEPAVRQWLDGLPARPVALTLTGHSLGGAMAVVAADSLRTLYPIGRVITFGSPRLASPEFAEAYVRSGLEAMTRRYIHQTDLVPRIPPAGMFQHVGAAYFITREGTIVPDEPEPTFQHYVKGLNEHAAELGRLGGSALLNVVAPGYTPPGTPQNTSWVNSLLSQFQPLLYAYAGYVLLGLAAVVSLFAAGYVSLRSWLRIHALKQDADRHAMDGYMTAFTKLQGEWSQRFTNILGGNTRLFGGLAGLDGFLGTQLFPPGQNSE
jgi:hypothetical protein